MGGKEGGCYLCLSSPLTVGLTACLIRLVWRLPIVCDIQDMWPDTLRATGMVSSPKVLGIVDRVCRWVYKRADSIVVLSPGFKRLLIERGVPEGKIDVIYNWADESALSFPVGDLPLEFPDEDYFRIVFAGNMGKAQALVTVPCRRITAEGGCEDPFCTSGRWCGG